MNKSATIQEFLNSAGNNAYLLRQMIAAVYGTSEDKVTIQVNIAVEK